MRLLPDNRGTEHSVGQLQWASIGCHSQQSLWDTRPDYMLLMMLMYSSDGSPITGERSVGQLHSEECFSALVLKGFVTEHQMCWKQRLNRTRPHHQTCGDPNDWRSKATRTESNPDDYYAIMSSVVSMSTTSSKSGRVLFAATVLVFVTLFHLNSSGFSTILPAGSGLLSSSSSVALDRYPSSNKIDGERAIWPVRSQFFWTLIWSSDRNSGLDGLQHVGW